MPVGPFGPPPVSLGLTDASFFSVITHWTYTCLSLKLIGITQTDKQTHTRTSKPIDLTGLEAS